MSLKTRTKTKFYKDLNLGVVIIFLIVTLAFVISLSKNYSKGLFNHQTEIRK